MPINWDLLIIIILIAIGAISYFSYTQHQNLVQFQQTGTVAFARITNITSSSSSGRHSHYHNYVVLNYEANGILTRGALDVSSSFAESVGIGGQLRIIYLPSDPSVCRLHPVTAEMVAADPNGLIPFIGLSIFLGVFSGWQIFRRRSRNAGV